MISPKFLVNTLSFSFFPEMWLFSQGKIIRELPYNNVLVQFFAFVMFEAAGKEAGGEGVIHGPWFRQRKMTN